ncbi:MAG: acetyl-CoA carboxylase biotin carboxyl carrier protein [Chloroflexi bacterium]|nr:acetyl-CoA carboxylase biotin carboxyl carrier protein [Chloroflexota bacterium]
MAGDAPGTPDASGPGTPDAPDAPETAQPTDRGDTRLLGLIDQLAVLLERSDLSELEVESGGTTLVLRKPVAVPRALAQTATNGSVVGGPPSDAPAVGGRAATDGRDTGAIDAGRPSIKAPLTGIFYASPAPGSAPYVQVGGEVAVGQVIGLIEAMKLFNEIKSDLAGRVVRVVPESGALVKAKQPLIEVEPL